MKSAGDDSTSLNFPSTDPLSRESTPQTQGSQMISHVESPHTQGSLPQLTPKSEKELVQIFKLLSDETRLRILMYLLHEGELHVTALCEKLRQSQPAVSHHLALLRVARLIEARRDGKHNFYSVRSGSFRRLISQLFENLLDDQSAPVAEEEFAVA